MKKLIYEFPTDGTTFRVDPVTGRIVVECDECYERFTLVSYGEAAE
jgi:hypothetical protein